MLADTIWCTVELEVPSSDASVAGELAHLFCAPATVDLLCADSRRRPGVETKPSGGRPIC
ncbi:hypothetical protein ACWGLC_12710 [Dietzia sp. NPDC055877]